MENKGEIITQGNRNEQVYSTENQERENQKSHENRESNNFTMTTTPQFYNARK